VNRLGRPRHPRLDLAGSVPGSASIYSAPRCITDALAAWLEP